MSWCSAPIAMGRSQPRTARWTSPSSVGWKKWPSIAEARHTSAAENAAIPARPRPKWAWTRRKEGACWVAIPVAMDRLLAHAALGGVPSSAQAGAMKMR